MAPPKILLVGDYEVTFVLEHFLSLLGYNCHILKASELDAGLDIASQELPSVIFLEDRLIAFTHFDQLRKFNVLTPKPYLIVFDVSFDNTEYLRELLQAGVDDYMLRPFWPEGLKKSLEPILGQVGNKNNELGPIVEKLLNKVEQQEKVINELGSDINWYVTNLGKEACDCEDTIKLKRSREPKSTALRRVKAHVYDFDDEEYQCEVCNTIWVKAESHTESEYLVTWTPKSITH